MQQGESMKKGTNHAKVQVLSNNYIFHVAIFKLIYTAFFTQMFKLNIRIEAKYDI
jgi:hypothetical protein